MVTTKIYNVEVVWCYIFIVCKLKARVQVTLAFLLFYGVGYEVMRFCSDDERWSGVVMQVQLVVVVVKFQGINEDALVIN